MIRETFDATKKNFFFFFFFILLNTPHSRRRLFRSVPGPLRRVGERLGFLLKRDVEEERAFIE